MVQQGGLDSRQVGKIIKVVLSAVLELTSNQGQCLVKGWHFKKNIQSGQTHRVDKTVLLQRTVGWVARSINQSPEKQHFNYSLRHLICLALTIIEADITSFKGDWGKIVSSPNLLGNSMDNNMWKNIGWNTWRETWNMRIHLCLCVVCMVMCVYYLCNCNVCVNKKRDVSWSFSTINTYTNIQQSLVAHNYWFITTICCFQPLVACNHSTFC